MRVDAEALHVGERAIPRAALRGAELVPAHDGTLFVRVSPRRGLATDLGVSDRKEGRRVLRALGFDASQSVAHFWSRSYGFIGRGALYTFVLIPIVLGTMALLLEPAPWILGVGIKAVALLVVGGIAAMAIPARVDVGADGVLLRWLGTRRFIPLAVVRAGARATEGMGKTRHVGVRLVLAGGDSVWLPMGDPRWADERAGARCSTGFGERLKRRAETRAERQPQRLFSGVARAARGSGFRSCGAIGAGANADLRTAPVAPEQLWRIVESHGAAPEDRAAAAIALTPLLDDSGKERLGVAVDAVADERLRIAIDAAVKEDDAALEEALDEMSEPPRAKRSASSSFDG